ncbi:WxL protein peptidoglycan domain-containing protein [Streptomyces sp. NPDC002758]
MISTSARRIAAVLAACLLAVLPAAHASAAAPEAGGTGRTTFGVQPSAAKKPDARPNFSYGATPGARVMDHIAVFNYGKKPLTLRVYAQDAFTTADGGFDLFPAKHRPKDAGSWIKVGKSRVKVPPRSRVIVPFTLSIPAKATPGDHVGGIVASLAATATDKKGDRVAVDQRVGARVYLRVAGELTARLAVEDLHTAYQGTANPFGSGSATVTYTLRNTGNVRLAAHQSVRVRDGLGGTAKTAKVRDLPELLPGDAIQVSTSATGVRPAFRDTTTVTVDPEPVRGDVKFRILPRVTQTEAFTAVPWALLALVLVLAAIVTFEVIRRRRRRNSASPSARSPRKTSGTKQAVGLAAVLLVTGALLAGTPTEAQAATGGSLAVTPAKGTDTEPINLTAEAPCPKKTVNVIARVRGAGFPREGQIVVGNAPLSIYQTVPGGGLVIPLIYTMKDYASIAGFTDLRGKYTFTVSCLKGAFDLTSLKDFTGSLDFGRKNAYRDGTKVALPKAAAGAASTPATGGTATTAPGQPSQQGQQQGEPNGLPVPGQTPSGSAPAAGAAPLDPARAGAAEVSTDSSLTAWAVGGFSVCLLALVAGVVLWARGRRADAARPDTGE